ncbi:hypothetical protein ZYGR_0I03380 [Zygosaccharomyces rouxii]|uniref:Protein PET117, mitochondrial n=1 Tax=Zygosaccharomyces rouxii TaxID=4956 RepID=A0A1Q2ZX53_ZYGRO|nr:hypothetical protein ZYGR_0I03380 [Zygosaccharomyces rouxii]
MSRASKITFTLSCILTATTVVGVHVVQGMERETLHQGPIKDAKRVAAKQQQRQSATDEVDDTKSRKRIFNAAEHEEQLELRRKYESMQPLSGNIKTKETEEKGKSQ